MRVSLVDTARPSKMSTTVLAEPAVASPSIEISEAQANEPWRRITESALGAVLAFEIKCLFPLIAEYVGGPDTSFYARCTLSDGSSVADFGTDEAATWFHTLLCARDGVEELQLDKCQSSASPQWNYGPYYHILYRVRRTQHGVEFTPGRYWNPVQLYGVEASKPETPIDAWPLPFGGPTLATCRPGIYRLLSTGAVFDMYRLSETCIKLVRRPHPNDPK